MKSQWQALFEKYDALNERERIMIMLLTFVAIIIIFVELLISPLNQKYDVIDKQIVSLQTQSKQLESQIALLNSKKTRDPDFQEKQKIKLLNEQIANINVSLKEKMHGLIEPKQMAKVLELVLAQNTDLKLQRVQSMGAVPLSPLKAKEGETATELGIYQHGMQIEFKGSYLSTLSYLKSLSKLPWNFYWDVLELNVEKYPVSTIVITVHTLSFHEGWIGV
ncbi:MAG: type II secretion system protein M [Gammaproteobacteria bacterium]|nr:type II secretion system protein M [Gammaproteobacteria bacterium]MCW8987707.1 type II secretion system protein M [Gammaproteobacteria bacterium]MCW9032456.1 type II secretion system protein M [Gammaproteobacteria bacterium]